MSHDRALCFKIAKIRKDACKNFSEITHSIWTIVELLRDDFKRSKYQDVVLPLSVLMRIDCVLERTKAEVLSLNRRLRGKLENLDPEVTKANSYSFYNTSRYSFEKSLDDPP